MLTSISTTCRAGVWLAVFELLACTGCGPEAHIQRLQSTSMGGARVEDVRALRGYVGQPRVAEALIGALDDPDPAVRFFSAEVITDHIPRMNDQMRQRALSALVNCLEQNCMGFYTDWSGVPKVPLIGVPLVPVGTNTLTGSIRARALLTLTEATGIDCGFDRSAWRKRIASLPEPARTWPELRK